MYPSLNLKNSKHHTATRDRSTLSLPSPNPRFLSRQTLEHSSSNVLCLAAMITLPTNPLLKVSQKQPELSPTTGARRFGPSPAFQATPSASSSSMQTSVARCAQLFWPTREVPQTYPWGFACWLPCPCGSSCSPALSCCAMASARVTTPWSTRATRLSSRSMQPTVDTSSSTPFPFRPFSHAC